MSLTHCDVVQCNAGYRQADVSHTNDLMMTLPTRTLRHYLSFIPSVCVSLSDCVSVCVCVCVCVSKSNTSADCDTVCLSVVVVVQVSH